MGHIIRAPTSADGMQRKTGAKHSSTQDWINMVSGDSQQRYGASMLLPLTNVSGKAKQATIKVREWAPPGSESIEDLARCQELGGLRGIRVIDSA